MMEEPTVKTTKDFTTDELELIIEALKLYENNGRRMALRLTSEDGDDLGLIGLEDIDSLTDRLLSGDMFISPSPNGPPLTEKEQEILGELSSMFIGGLKVAEVKLSKLIEETATNGLPDVMRGFTELLKKQSE